MTKNPRRRVYMYVRDTKTLSGVAKITSKPSVLFLKQIYLNDFKDRTYIYLANLGQ
jgi:hypothetical protein